MNAAIESQLQTLLDNKVQLFSEFALVEPTMDSESLKIESNTIVKDIKGIYHNNNAKVPLLNSLIDGGLNIMTIAFSNFKNQSHPGGEQVSWDENYPVKRYYISNQPDDNTVSVLKPVVHEVDNSIRKMMCDWKTDVRATYNQVDGDAVYLCIEIWDDAVAPTEIQSTAYYMYYGREPRIVKLSTPLQTFVDNN